MLSRKDTKSVRTIQIDLIEAFGDLPNALKYRVSK